MANGINSLPTLADAVLRNFQTKIADPLLNVALTSGICEYKKMPANSRAVYVASEAVSTNQLAGDVTEGGTPNQIIPQLGYDKAIYLEERGGSFEVTKTLRMTTPYLDLYKSIVTSVIDSVINRRDADITHRLTFAFSTTYTNYSGNVVDITCGDGLALASASHTVTGGASTYRNIVNNNPAFSKGALSLAHRIAVENTIDNKGQKMGLTYDILFCSDDQDTNIAIDELLNATADVTSNNAGTYNFYASNGANSHRKVRLPRLATLVNGSPDTTKRTYWGLIASKNPPIMYCEWEAPYSKTPMDGNNGENASTENWNFLSFARYGIGTISGRGLIISKGDGTAG